MEHWEIERHSLKQQIADYQRALQYRSDDSEYARKEIDKLYEKWFDANTVAYSFQITTIIEADIKDIVKKIRNVDSLDGWTMKDMRKIIQNEVTRLRNNGAYLFRAHVPSHDYLYDNDINTNIKDWWNERCELAHTPNYADRLNHSYFKGLSDVLQDMLHQVLAAMRI